MNINSDSGKKMRRNTQFIKRDTSSTINEESDQTLN